MASKPSIPVFPEDSISVVEGRNAILPVKIIGQSSLTWYHDNTRLGSDYAHEISSDGSLTIITAEMSHSGTYRLVASNNEGAVEKQVQLSVINEEDEETLPSAVQTAEESEPIPVTGFGQYVSQNHANTNHGFTQLYKVSHDFLSLSNNLQYRTFLSCSLLTVVKVITQLQLVLLQPINHSTDSKTLQSVSIIHVHSKNTCKSLLSTSHFR